jgi:hypothetical protein
MSDINTINDLRDSLANELKRISSGETTPASANAYANICGKILSSVKLELEYNKMVGTTPKIDFIISQNKEKQLENKG